MDSFSALIDRWPSIGEFARAVGIPESHARTMKARDSVPPLYWPRLVAAAQERQLDGITHEALAELYAARRSSEAVA